MILSKQCLGLGLSELISASDPHPHKNPTVTSLVVPIPSHVATALASGLKRAPTSGRKERCFKKWLRKEIWRALTQFFKSLSDEAFNSMMISFNSRSRVGAVSLSGMGAVWTDSQVPIQQSRSRAPLVDPEERMLP